MIMWGLASGLLFCSTLLACRLISMLASDRPYWGGSVAEGYIDKNDKPRAHMFYVAVIAFALAVSIGMAVFFIWAIVHS